MKRFRKFFRNRFKQLLADLEVYYIYPEQEILHNVRVELKKINTMFRIIKYSTDTFNKGREFRHLKKIFRDAGRIREIHLICKLIAKYKISGINVNFLQEEEEKRNLDFRKNIQQFKKNIYLTFIKTERYSEKVNSGKLAEYLLNKQITLQKLINPFPDQDVLHNVRKIMKDIVYISDIIYGRPNKIEPLFDEVQNIIGKWHDKQVLIFFLNQNYSFSHRHVIEKLITSCLSDTRSVNNIISNIQSKEFIQVR